MPGVVPRASDRERLASLRDDLTEARYTVAAVDELLGPVASAALHREQVVPTLRRLEHVRAGADVRADGAALSGTGVPSSPARPVATLVRLLVLGREVSRGDLDAALPRTGTDGAHRLGLVEPAGSGAEDPVHALVDLRPYAIDAAEVGDVVGPGIPAAATDWWIASDLGELATGAALRPDHVLGVGGASTTLAQVTIRTPRRRTLDLGTGCGIQALHAARHSDTVVATDLSTRALAFARFNAALADVELDLRHGSMLDPVRDEPGGFDLVVSNPPFVITPRASGLPTYEYRDAGRAGDDVVRDLITGVGRVLAPGGVAQLLGNWEHRRGQDWRERVGDWVDRSGLDAWVVQRDVQDPAEYAETWLRDGGTTAERDPAGWAAGYRAWLDDLASRQVEAVGFGLVLLRRPVDGRPTLRRLEEHVGPVHQPLGPHLERALAAHDWVTGPAADDAVLAGARLAVAADVTEERHLRPGAADPTLVLLRQGDGFGRTVRVGSALAGLVGACDGELTVGQIVGGIAALLDAPSGSLGAELLPQVRDLVRDGFLRF